MKIMGWPTRWLFSLILSLSAAVSVYRLISVPPEFGKGQTDVNWPIVNSLLDGRGFSLCYPLYFPFCDPVDQPTAMREPLPALIFAAVAAFSGRSLEAALTVQALAFLVVLVLLFQWVRGWAGDRVALIAALFWALCLPAIQAIPQLSGDLIGAAFFLGAVMLYGRARTTHLASEWMLAGILLGLAALCRSVLLFTVIPWAMLAFAPLRDRPRWRRHAVINAAAIIAGTLLAVAPWAIRNHNVFDRWWPGTSMNGYNLFRNSYQVLDHQPPHYVGAREAKVMLDSLLARRIDLRGDEDEGEMDRVYMDEGKRAVKANPLGFARLVLYRFIPLWTNYGVPESYDRVVTLFDRAILLQQVLLLLLLFIGLRGMWDGLWPWNVTIALQVLLYMAVVAQVRYLLPVLPLVMAIAAVGVTRVLGKKST